MDKRTRKVVLSGMRPTGPLHLGHLFGVLDRWVAMQDDYECYFMIADWHALMSEYKNPDALSENIRSMMVDWLSVGLDPQKSALFVQSEIVEHLELYMLFSIITPIGWLERCPTYKEQLENLAHKEVNTHAFLGYPVLQAADILIYAAEAVPVGEDQIPHLELAREIVRRFEYLFGCKLPEPQALLSKAPRLLGIDGRKMSKSYDNFISLTEESEGIKKKVMMMVTDPNRMRRDDPGNPDVCSVYDYVKYIFPDEKSAEIDRLCRGAGIGCVECKKMVAEAIDKRLQPIRERRRAIEADPAIVAKAFEAGRQKAKDRAASVWSQIKERIWRP